MVKTGAKVTWSYQASGVSYEQTGKVLALVTAGNSAEDVFGDIVSAEVFQRQKKFADSSSNDRYLVEVTLDGGNKVWYAPTVSLIEKLNPKAVKAWAKENLSVAKTEDISSAPEYEVVAEKPAEPLTVSNKYGVAPVLDEQFKMGNQTSYRTFAIKDDNNFVGYRLYGSAGVKLCIFGRHAVNVQGSYKSHVREAQSAVVTSALNDEEATSVSQLTTFEVKQFAESLAGQLSEYGYSSVSLDRLIADLKENAEGNTRRKVVAKIGKN